jgi:hypothetical protein
MSEDPTNLTTMAATTLQQHGWIVAAVTSSWAVVLRVLIGQILEDRKQIRSRLTHIEAMLLRQDERLKSIEARSTFRRRYDRTDLLEDNNEENDV